MKRYNSLNDEYFEEPNYTSKKFKFGMRILIAANPTILRFPINNKPYYIEVGVYL